MSSGPRLEAGGERRRGGPWLLALPLFVGALALRLALEREPPAADRPARPASIAASEVAGHAGLLAFPDGSRLSARLARLHAAPAERERQRFDAEVLRARLGLEEGEPFRLALSWRAEHAPSDPAAPDPAAREREGAPSPLELVLAELVVRDGEGEALRVLAPPAPSAEGAADPLAVLLAPPREALRPGESIELVLWGREPGPGARVEASVLQTGAERGCALELAPRALMARSEAELARVERRSAR